MHYMYEQLVNDHIRELHDEAARAAARATSPPRRRAATRWEDLAPHQPTHPPPDTGSDLTGADARHDEVHHVTTFPAGGITTPCRRRVEEADATKPRLATDELRQAGGPVCSRGVDGLARLRL